MLKGLKQFLLPSQQYKLSRGQASKDALHMAFEKYTFSGRNFRRRHNVGPVGLSYSGI